MAGVQPASPCPPASQASQPTSPSLFTLAQELQDIIFDLAFPRTNAIYIEPKRWNIREKNRWRDSGRVYTRRPIPPPFVARLLVSRAFFIAAAKAWASNQDFVESITFSGDPGPLLQGIVASYAKHMTIESATLTQIAGAQGLRSITVSVEQFFFDCLDDAAVWEDELSERHFEQVLRETIWGYLKRVSDAVSVRLCDGRCNRHERNTPVWADNIMRFEKYIRECGIQNSTRLTGDERETGAGTSQKSQASEQCAKTFETQQRQKLKQLLGAFDLACTTSAKTDVPDRSKVDPSEPKECSGSPGAALWGSVAAVCSALKGLLIANATDSPPTTTLDEGLANLSPVMLNESVVSKEAPQHDSGTSATGKGEAVMTSEGGVDGAAQVHPVKTATFSNGEEPATTQSAAPSTESTFVSEADFGRDILKAMVAEGLIEADEASLLSTYQFAFDNPMAIAYAMRWNLAEHELFSGLTTSTMATVPRTRAVVRHGQTRSVGRRPCKPSESRDCPSNQARKAAAETAEPAVATKVQHGWLPGRGEREEERVGRQCSLAKGNDDHMAAAQLAHPATSSLTLSDMPHTMEGVTALCAERGLEVMKWFSRMKEPTGIAEGRTVVGMKTMWMMAAEVVIAIASVFALLVFWELVLRDWVMVEDYTWRMANDRGAQYRYGR